MMIPQELTVEAFFDGERIDATKLREFLSERRVNAIVCGPGWMRQCLTVESLGVLRDFALNGGGVILDAGALHGIFNLLEKVGKFPEKSLILTPHHGEWLKLQDLAAPPPLNPDGAASAAIRCKSLGATIMYKNAAPVIVAPDDSSPVICASGTPILSRAGSGDLLCGLIGAHMAIGCGPVFAAARAYTLLSRTAWIAAQDVGEDAVIGTDILSRLGIGARM
jgi:NAD(P)H-hydrate epimerase